VPGEEKDFAAIGPDPEIHPQGRTFVARRFYTAFRYPALRNIAIALFEEASQARASHLGVSKSWGRGLRSMTRGDILLGD
jgi:hypothetical protein